MRSAEGCGPREWNPFPISQRGDIQSKAELAAYLEGLVGEAGVTEVLVIGGGVGTPVGPYAETMDVLASGRLEAMGIRKVGVAGHPEGSPDISADDARHRARRQKRVGHADRHRDLHIETQFCFDGFDPQMGKEHPRCQRHCRSISALPSLASLKTLLKFAQVSGGSARPCGC